jgi:hypothetical protein
MDIVNIKTTLEQIKAVAEDQQMSKADRVRKIGELHQSINQRLDGAQRQEVKAHITPEFLASLKAITRHGNIMDPTALPIPEPFDFNVMEDVIDYYIEVDDEEPSAEQGNMPVVHSRTDVQRRANELYDDITKVMLPNVSDTKSIKKLSYDLKNLLSCSAILYRRHIFDNLPPKGNIRYEPSMFDFTHPPEQYTKGKVWTDIEIFKEFTELFEGVRKGGLNYTEKGFIMNVDKCSMLLDGMSACVRPPLNE